MNKELEFKDGKVIVTDEYEREIERKLSSNIEQILITENNIEEIEKLLVEKKSSLKLDKSFINLSKSFYGVSILWFFSFVSNLLAKNIFPAVCNLLCSILWTGSQHIMHTKPTKKKLKIKEKSISILEEHLNEEKEILNELENEKNNNCNYVDTSKKHFTTSEKILKLRVELSIIEDYINNKQKYIKYYNEGVLNTLLTYYSDSNLVFIEELIKNDLDNNKSKIKEKQKTLTK